MTSPQTTPARTNGHHPIGTPGQGGQHPLAGMVAVPDRRERRHPFNRQRVRYARSWLGLGAGVAALGALGLRRYGRRAALGYGLLGLASVAYMALVEPARPRLEQVTLRLPGLPPS